MEEKFAAEMFMHDSCPKPHRGGGQACCLQEDYTRN